MDFKMHRDGKGVNPRIGNDVTGVSECSQQRGNLKDDGYIGIGFLAKNPILSISILRCNKDQA